MTSRLGAAKYCLAGGLVSPMAASSDKPPPTRHARAGMPPPSGTAAGSVSRAPRPAINGSATITPCRVLSDPWGIRWPSQAFAAASAPQTLAAPSVKAGSKTGLELVAVRMAPMQSRPQMEAWRYNSTRACLTDGGIGLLGSKSTAGAGGIGGAGPAGEFVTC